MINFYEDKLLMREIYFFIQIDLIKPQLPDGSVISYLSVLVISFFENNLCGVV